MKARLAVISLIVLGIIISFTEVSKAAPIGLPTNLVASNDGGPINLSWTGTVGVGTITYEIYRDTTSTVTTGSLHVGDTTATNYRDTATVDGTTYYYAVRAVDSFDGVASALSDTASATSNSPPPAPTNLTATLVNRGINLAWNPVTGMVYNVYRYVFSGITKASPRIVTQTSGTSYRDTAVSNGQTYYYAVTAVDPIDLTESDVSNEVSATSVFNPPSNLTAVNNLGPIDLSWSATTGFGTITYNVYRNTILDFATSSMIRTGEINIFWTDSGTVDGTLYYYWVTGVDSADGVESSPSTEASAVSNWPPPAPTGMTAAAVGRAIYLDWNRVSGMVYNVYRATSSGVNKSSPIVANEISETDFLDITVTVGQTYYYVVTSVDPADMNPATRESNISSEVLAVSIFTPPSNLSAANAKGPISLSWTGTSGLGTITYNVYRSDTPSASESSRIASGITKTTYLDEGTLDRVTYYYWVSAVDSFDGLESSASGMAQATALYPPPTPSSLETTDKDGQGRPLSREVRLIWEGVTLEGEVVTYRVYRHTSSPVPVDLAHRVATGLQNPNYIDNPPADETPYFYVVASFTPYRGESDPSNEAVGVAHFIPPSNLKAENDKGMINLTWEKTRGRGIITYNVYRSTSFGVTPEPVNLVKSGLWGTTWSDGKTVDQVKYYYIVTAVDSADGAESPSSNEASAKAVYPASPTVPSDLATETEKRKIVLTWTASQLQGGSEGPITYRVYRSRTRPVEVNDTNLLVQGLTTATYTDFNVENKVTYWYVVTAVDESSSLVSNPGGPVMGISFFDPPSGLKATNQTGEGEEGQIKLEWTKTEGIGLVTYNVYRSSPLVPTPILKVSGLMNPEWTDIDTANNARYCYQVTAVDSFDNLESDPSNISCATSYHKQSVSNITIFPSTIEYETNGPEDQPNQLEYTTITLDVKAGPTDSDGNVSTVKKLIIEITDVGIAATPKAAVFEMYNLSSGTYDLNWDGEWTELESGECRPIKHNSVYSVTAWVVNHNDDESLQIESGPAIVVDVVHVQGGVKIIYQEVGDMPPAHVPPFKFEYRLTKDAYVTFRFYDTNNTAENLRDDILVKTIVHETPRPGELADRDFTNIDIWDGKGDDGKIVPNGIYRVAIDARERRFNPDSDMADAWTDVNTTVAVDILRILDLDVTGISADNPLAEIRYILSGSGFAEGGTGGGMEVTLNIYKPGTTIDADGNCTDANGNAIDTASVLVKSFTISRDLGQNTEYWDGRDEEGGLLPNGVYVFTLMAKDTYGNLALDDEGNDGILHGNIPVDRTPDQTPGDVTNPKVVSTQPANGEIVSFSISQVSAMLKDEEGGAGLDLEKSTITLLGPDGRKIPSSKSDNGINTIRLQFEEQTETGAYTIRVVAVDNAGNQSPPVTASFVLSDQFLPPANLTAVTTLEGNIKLEWEAAVSKGEVTYRIYRDTRSDVSKESELVDSGITTTAWTDTKVRVRTKYYYIVTAVDVGTGEESDPSNMATPEKVVVLPRVTNLTAECVDRIIKLKWDLYVEEREEWGEISMPYNVYRHTSLPVPADEDHLISAGTLLTEYTDAEVENGVTYYYVVTVFFPATNEESSPSDPASATSVFLPPTGLTAVSSKEEGQEGAIRLSWQPTTGKGTITYNIYKSDTSMETVGPSYLVQTGLTTNQWTDQATINGGKYYYLVTAVDSDDKLESEPSNQASAISYHRQQIHLKIINPLIDFESGGVPTFAVILLDVVNGPAQEVEITITDKRIDQEVAKFTLYDVDSSQIIDVTTPQVMVNMGDNINYGFASIWDEKKKPTIAVNGIPVSEATYMIDCKSGRITFKAPKGTTDIVTVTGITYYKGAVAWDGLWLEGEKKGIKHNSYDSYYEATAKITNYNGDVVEGTADSPIWVDVVHIQEVELEYQKIGDVPPAYVPPYKITYTLTKDAFVTIEIYDRKDMSLVKRIVHETPHPGESLNRSMTNTYAWDGKDSSGRSVPNGVYRFVIKAQEFRDEPTDRASWTSAEGIAVDVLRILDVSATSISSDNPLAEIIYTLTGPGFGGEGTSGGKVTINIYTPGTLIDPYGRVSNGELVKTITGFRTQGTNTETWDGRDEKRNYLSSGIYPFTITAEDGYGNLAVDAEGNDGPIHGAISVNRPPTEIRISKLLVKGIAVVGDKAEISYTLEAAGLDLTGGVEVNINIYEPGTTIGADGTATGGAMVRSLTFYREVGSHTEQWDGRDTANNRVEEGIYPFIITAVIPEMQTWARGQISVSWEEKPVVAEDVIDPEIVYTIPEDGATLTTYISEVSAYLQDEDGGSGIDLKASSIVLRDPAGNKISGTKETDAAGTITLRLYSEQSTPGKYTMEVTALDKAGNQKTKAAQFTLSEEAVSALGIQDVYSYPHPAKKQNPKIHYNLPSPARVTIKIFTLMGDRVRTIEVEEQKAGEYSQEWNLENDDRDLVSSGVYIYTIEATGMDTVKGKMVIIR